MLSILLFAINNYDRNKIITNLYQKYYADMCRYARSFVHNDEDAKDVVSNVFLSIMNKSEKLDNMSENEQKGYLCMSVKNRSFNSLKKTGLDLEHAISEEFNESTMTAIYDDYKFEEADQSYVAKAINTLRPNYRRAILLKYNADYTYEEIAKEMGISTRHVGVILNRAKGKIKKAIVEMKQNDKER